MTISAAAQAYLDQLIVGDPDGPRPPEEQALYKWAMGMALDQRSRTELRMTDIPDDLLALLHVTSREDGSPELDERTGQFALALFLLTDPQFQHGATAHVKVDDTIRAMQTFMVCLSLEKARRAGFLEVTYDADPFDHTGKVSMLPTTKLMPLVDAYRAGWRPPQPAAAGG